MRRAGRGCSPSLRTLAGLATVAALVLLAGCDRTEPSRAAPAPGDPPSSVAVALTEEPTGFNVHLPEHAGASARDVVGRLWPSAYRILPDGTYAPSLLARPATVVSEDPYVLEWLIRAEADWSDGTPVTSADAEYLWSQCSAGGAGATCVEAGSYRHIVAFERVDDKRFRTTFDALPADHELLFRLIPPAHVATRRPGGWEGAFDADPGASAGPFRFGEWKLGDEIGLVRNDRWFGRRAAVEELRFVVTDEEGLVDALRTGGVDVVVPPATLPAVRALLDLPDADVQFGAAPELEVLTFNVAHPLLADPAVRRAAVLALDRTELVESLVVPLNPDAARVDNRLFPSRHPSYQAQAGDLATRDVDAARATLAEAGFAPTADGGWARDDVPLDLRITTTSGVARREQLVQLVQSQLNEAGFRLHIENVAPGDLAAVADEGDFDLLVAPRPSEGAAFATAQQVYGCDGPANVAGLCDSALEERMAEAVSAPGPAEQVELLNLVDLALWDLLADVPLYETPVVVAHDPSVDGVVLNATAEGHLWNVETWTVPPYAGR